MKTSLLFALALAAALTGCNRSTHSNDTAAADTAAAPSSDYTATGNSTHAVTGNATASTHNAADDMRSAANSASGAIGDAVSGIATTARIAEWNLKPSDIAADLAADREIIRTKDAGAGAPTGKADADVLENLVKGRLNADSAIAPLKLDVDANKTGEVKLSGKAKTPEDVGRAIALALDTEGVTKVTSKIKLDADK
ncbi:BON domain-containing protein [Opitutus sp. ER46]|uniref:BON domain-containing protein n=1 Tax=Opitutus sp. ER46 TaxID=2161864 RepID=UPI000D30749D|nr:BON domain-containing protein [Opitutus sp. ER46]PTX95486.1 hypothetical protein DB354_08650 [Opitutus sp. ER46]